MQGIIETTMHYYEIAPTTIVRADSAVLTYSSSVPLAPGSVVAIPVGKRTLTGVVMREVQKPTYDTKQVGEPIASVPLPAQLIQLLQWMSEYYTTHLATVLQTALPRGIQKSRRNRTAIAHQSIREKRTNIVFTEQQQSALATIDTMQSGTALLHGVTGSGKTHIYIEAAKRALARNTSVIVLVPEIALTSQLVDEFAHHFDDILLTHSKQSEAERHFTWLTALQSTTPRVVIGPRSALFMPLRNLGLIVIDEAHEPSFKQEQSPRYSALRAASVLAGFHKAKVLLGSATPLIADYYLAGASSSPIITLTERAQTDAVPPTITLVDMTKRPNFKRHRFLSDTLLSSIESTLADGKQALLFHNRRGSASTTLCTTCGWSATCARCFVPLTLHADTHELRCHICGAVERIPTSCPECHDTEIIHKGVGTKLIESEVKKLFPKANVMRFDGDSGSEDTIATHYQALYDGTIDIIVGTQVIAKGLDLPHLRTVGVIQADAGLSLPDFASSERTFQLLAQVVGRVGRSKHATTVTVQSYQPNHPAVVHGLNQQYQTFYELALAERQRGHFPPFSYLLKLTCSYKTEAAAIRNAQKLAATLRTHKHPDVRLLGPAPAFYERQRDSYRWQLTLKSPRRTHLVALLRHLPPTHWQSELDPTSLL